MFQVIGSESPPQIEHDIGLVGDDRIGERRVAKAQPAVIDPESRAGPGDARR